MRNDVNVLYDLQLIFESPTNLIVISDKNLIRVDLSRYICDICGAGLKRKEHLERHKLGE